MSTMDQGVLKEVREQWTSFLLTVYRR